MAFRLLLVRHGHTTWNGEGRLQGQIDTPLSALGEQQATRLQHRLAGERIDLAVVSDLQRTWRTAERAIAGRDVPVLRDPAWRELRFGEWEGLTYDEVMRRDPERGRARYQRPADVAPPGGETLRDVLARILPAVTALREQHEGETVLLVSHGGPIRVLGCHVLELDINRAWRLSVVNCGVSCIKWYGDEPIVELWNDALHLEQL